MPKGSKPSPAASASPMNPKVGFYFAKEEKWREEIGLLRTLALGCGLSEDLKWGCPCYALGDSNIVLIHVFKEYCAFLFFKGVLMKDPKGILVQQTANVQASRQIRFSGVQDIQGREGVLKAYIQEAVAVEKAGVKVPLKDTAQFTVVPEFQKKLDKTPALKKAFAALTPGRQRGYLLHFSQAKQSKTREARIEKYTPQILAGKGLDDL